MNFGFTIRVVNDERPFFRAESGKLDKKPALTFTTRDGTKTILSEADVRELAFWLNEWLGDLPERGETNGRS